MAEISTKLSKNLKRIRTAKKLAEALGVSADEMIK